MNLSLTIKIKRIGLIGTVVLSCRGPNRPRGVLAQAPQPDTANSVAISDVCCSF
jgi:hypothetical protein